MYRQNLYECWKVVRMGVLILTMILGPSLAILGGASFFIYLGINPGISLLLSLLTCCILAPFICAAWKTWVKPHFGDWFTL